MWLCHICSIHISRYPLHMILWYPFYITLDFCHLYSGPGVKGPLYWKYPSITMEGLICSLVISSVHPSVHPSVCR